MNWCERKVVEISSDSDLDQRKTQVTIVVLFYAFAYWRGTRQIIERSGACDKRSMVAGTINRVPYLSCLLMAT